MKRASQKIIDILNPADHFTLAMDEEIRRENMPGSLCGFALELDGIPDIERLEQAIERFCERFPVATARLQKIGRRFHWCERQRPDPIFIRHDCTREINASEAFHAGVCRIMNRKQARDELNPLELHLFQGKAEAVLLMRWTHPFCDAVGARLIFQALAADGVVAESEWAGQRESLLNQRLGRFGLAQKIGLFMKAKKLIEEIDEKSSILPKAGVVKPQRLNFKSIRLDPERSAEIAEISRGSVGLIGTSLYYIACLMRALDRLETRGDGDAFCVPYAFNLRKQNARSPVTGNQVSALFAQAPIEIVRDRDRLFRHLTQQYRRALSEKLDFAFLPLMWVAQWMSLERYGKTLRESFREGRERSSFWFSDIGQSDLAATEICGAPIRGLFHLTQVTTPPGLAVLCALFGKQLTLTYNFIEPQFDEDWILALHQNLVAELLGKDR